MYNNKIIITRLTWNIYQNMHAPQPFKLQHHKIVKHSQTILRQIDNKLFECIWHFVGSALKELRKGYMTLLKVKCFYECGLYEQLVGIFGLFKMWNTQPFYNKRGEDLIFSVSFFKKLRHGNGFFIIIFLIVRLPVTN